MGKYKNRSNNNQSKVKGEGADGSAPPAGSDFVKRESFDRKEQVVKPAEVKQSMLTKDGLKKNMNTNEKSSLHSTISSRDGAPTEANSDAFSQSYSSKHTLSNIISQLDLLSSTAASLTQTHAQQQNQITPRNNLNYNAAILSSPDIPEELLRMLQEQDIPLEEMQKYPNNQILQSLCSSESGSSSATKSSSMQTTPLKKQGGFVGQQSNQSVIDDKNQSVPERVINGFKNLFGCGTQSQIAANSQQQNALEPLQPNFHHVGGVHHQHSLSHGQDFAQDQEDYEYDYDQEDYYDEDDEDELEEDDLDEEDYPDSQYCSEEEELATHFQHQSHIEQLNHLSQYKRQFKLKLKQIVYQTLQNVYRNIDYQIIQENYKEMCHTIDELASLGVQIDTDYMLEIFHSKIKDVMQSVKKDLQDELFKTKILEKIVPERKYSLNDLKDHETYKQLSKHSQITDDVKKKTLQDLQSTQCKKALFYDQPKGYVKYIQAVINKWSIFHQASANVDSIWQHLLKEKFGVTSCGEQFDQIHQQLFYNEVYKHRYVILIIKDCISIQNRHYDAKFRRKPMGQGPQGQTEHEKFFQQIPHSDVDRFIDLMKKLDEIKTQSEKLEAYQREFEQQQQRQLHHLQQEQMQSAHLTEEAQKRKEKKKKRKQKKQTEASNGVLGGPHGISKGQKSQQKPQLTQQQKIIQQMDTDDLVSFIENSAGGSTTTKQSIIQSQPQTVVQPPSSVVNSKNKENKDSNAVVPKKQDKKKKSKKKKTIDNGSKGSSLQEKKDPEYDKNFVEKYNPYFEKNDACQAGIQGKKSSKKSSHHDSGHSGSNVHNNGEEPDEVDKEIEEFQKKLGMVDAPKKKRKIKPNVSQKWIQELRKKIQKAHEQRQIALERNGSAIGSHGQSKAEKSK